ncbi:MAG: flagellar assembly protein FliH [Gammaproteobacteria bacterium]|nr:flagellar assembly protein FliH [Gammaproteobacteria bacterium]
MSEADNPRPAAGQSPQHGAARKSRIISGDELSAYQRWELPAVEGTLGKNPNVLTAKQIEQIQKQAYEEGFAQGRQDGKAQVVAQAGRLAKLIGLLNEPLADLDQQVEHELVQLAMVIARALVRRELRSDPGAVVAVVREAMSVLPVAARHVSVHLHPEDAALVRGALALPEGERAWRIVEDPVLARGDCKVHTENSQIDASIESRLTSIVTAILGGERHDDRPTS